MVPGIHNTAPYMFTLRRCFVGTRCLLDTNVEILVGPGKSDNSILELCVTDSKGKRGARSGRCSIAFSASCFEKMTYLVCVMVDILKLAAADQQLRSSGRYQHNEIGRKENEE